MFINWLNQLVKDVVDKTVAKEELTAANEIINENFLYSLNLTKQPAVLTNFKGLPHH